MTDRFRMFMTMFMMLPPRMVTLESGMAYLGLKPITRMKIGTRMPAYVCMIYRDAEHISTYNLLSLDGPTGWGGGGNSPPPPMPPPAAIMSPRAVKRRPQKSSVCRGQKG